MTEGFLMLSNTRNAFTLERELGWHDVDDTEETRDMLGIQYLFPFGLESRAWVDSDGGIRVIVEKDFELTPRLTLSGHAEYDSHDSREGRVGLSYMAHKNVSFIGQWNSEYGFGAGLQIQF